METLGLSPSNPKPTSRIRELFWPAIEDEVAAVTAARNAMYACLFIAALTGVAGLMAGQGAWVWVDVLLYVMAGIGVRQLSRAAALTAMLMYALAWLVTGGLSILRPILLEELPRRAWPVIHGPFLVTLGLLVALNLFAINSLLFGRLFAVPTGSMAPTLDIGDRVFVLHAIFSGEVRRGDVVVVRYPADHKEALLKRVVGLPGDHIRILNKELWINGKKVIEPYVQHATAYVDAYRDNFPSQPIAGVLPSAIEMLQRNVRSGELIVPPGCYFVMGDNRDMSFDSRYWGFIGKDELLGRPVLIFGKGKRDFLRYPLGE